MEAADRDRDIGLAELAGDIERARILIGLNADQRDEAVFLADGNADFTRALGLEMDASGYGMGTRSKRFSLYAEDGVVRELFVEAPGEFRVSSAENVLAHLPG